MVRVSGDASISRTLNAAIRNLDWRVILTLPLSCQRRYGAADEHSNAEGVSKSFHLRPSVEWDEQLLGKSTVTRYSTVRETVPLTISSERGSIELPQSREFTMVHRIAIVVTVTCGAASGQSASE